MLHSLKKLFAANRKPAMVRRQALLMLESFEPRNAPSVSPMMPGGHGLFGPPIAGNGFGPSGPGNSFGPAHSPPSTAIADAVFSSGSFAQSGKVLTATLTGATGTSGTATFTPGATSGQNTFALTASGLTASTTYTVDVGTTSIGTFTTDATGAGTLSLSNITAAITKGTAVTVLDPTSTTTLQGTFGGGGCQGGSEPAAHPLTVTLTGATGTSGTVTFTPGATTGQNTFALTASGLTASSTYTVEVGTTSIGTFTTDATGAGTLSLSNITAAIAPGSVITVLHPTGATVLQGTAGGGGCCQHH